MVRALDHHYPKRDWNVLLSELRCPHVSSRLRGRVRGEMNAELGIEGSVGILRVGATGGYGEEDHRCTSATLLTWLLSSPTQGIFEALLTLT